MDRLFSAYGVSGRPRRYAGLPRHVGSGAFLGFAGALRPSRLYFSRSSLSSRTISGRSAKRFRLSDRSCRRSNNLPGWWWAGAAPFLPEPLWLAIVTTGRVVDQHPGALADRKMPIATMMHGRLADRTVVRLPPMQTAANTARSTDCMVSSSGRSCTTDDQRLSSGDERLASRPHAGGGCHGRRGVLGATPPTRVRLGTKNQLQRAPFH